MEKLKRPDYELRVEARVRPSHSPRRVNFMINTQRTTDFHEHLREYDLAQKSDWQVISMTTRNFDAGPGDEINVQLGVTDWGPGKYYVDLDYYRAEVVKVADAKPDGAAAAQPGEKSLSFKEQMEQEFYVQLSSKPKKHHLVQLVSVSLLKRQLTVLQLIDFYVKMKTQLDLFTISEREVHLMLITPQVVST